MSGNFASCLVQLSPDSGLDGNTYIVLDRKPTRQEQRLKTLSRYIEKHSSGWKKRLELADLLYEMGQWSKAILQYNQVIQAQPQLLKPHIKLGKILQLMNRQQEAIAVYENAVVLAKKKATRQHLLGLIQSCQGKTKEAITSFKSATTLEPENLAHWLALVQKQIEVEPPAIALATLETILSFEPDNFMALIYSHDLLLILRHFPQAEKCLNQAQKIAPQDIQTLKRIIASRCRKKLVFAQEGKQTKKLINSLLQKAQSSPEASSLQAQYYILRGEQAKGLKILKQFTEKHEGNPHGWYYYSQALFNLSRHEAAANTILRAYELSAHQSRPDTPQVYQALCKMLPATPEIKQNWSHHR
ncbi:MAG: tetratricopeptide repeat protein [Spirulinaceae cyanobacterium]